MLYKRITADGTIDEPSGKPDPQFALPSTVNWMRSLALLVENDITFASSKAHYAADGKRAMSAQVENTIFEQLFLGLHHLSALEQMVDPSRAADFSRVATLGWYYGISNAAAAMTAAQNGSFQADHSSTARMWDIEVAARGKALGAFGWRASSLVEKTYKAEMQSYRQGSSASLLSTPYTHADALGAATAYLSGSAKWYASYATDDLRNSAAFKALGVDNFMTKKAQNLRNEKLAQRRIGFIHQASRYRGKANYREALFLGYGSSTGTILSSLVQDQATVLRSFLQMAGAFSSRKLGKDLWQEFVADVDMQRAFSVSALSVWS
ncbi:hypothetical protein BH10PSE1_BH10PSE1_16540 [soil metagenome]